MSLRLCSWLLATVVVAMEASVVAAPAAEILCGQTLVGLLASGPDEIGFHAREGEVVSATVVPLLPLPGFDPWWRIADVEGRPIALSNANDDNRCEGRCETAPLPSGETFTLRIADSGIGVGAYVVSLEAVSATANGATNGPPSPACFRDPNGDPDGTRAITDATLAGAIDGAGETDTFTLDAQAGDAVRVTLAATGGDGTFAPVWDAFDAAGTRLDLALANETAPVVVDGVVTILVSDGSLRATGTYTIGVNHHPPSTTTTTTTGETSTTTTSLETTTTTEAAATTSTSTTAPESSSTSTSSAPPASTTTTTATLPGATTSTTLVPEIDLELAILAPPLGPRAMLGRAIAAASGRLLIGAPHEDVGPARDRVRDAGAVLVVDVAGAPGTSTFGTFFRIARPDAQASKDEFGGAVALVGDGMLVGAPGIRLAYFFANVRQTTPSATYEPPGADTGDRFGAAVAAPDGLVVVGAPEADGGAGVAYVFERATGALRHSLKPPTVTDRGFGAALAANGTLILVGAPGGAGRAFLFDAATGDLRKTFAPNPPVAGDEFGSAVAFAGDDVVIGAPGAAGSAGRVDRFVVDTGLPTCSYVSPNPAAGARFGASVAVADGLLAVGAPGVSHDGVASGAAYAFDVDRCALTSALEKAMPQAGDGFGTAVATAAGRVFVGTPGDDSGSIEGGTTYVFDGEMMVAALRERLSFDAFGSTGALGDGVAYVGAPGGGPGALGFVSRFDGDAPIPSANLFPPSALAGRFGASVGVLGSTVVVGEPEWDSPTTPRAGRVHLFDGVTPREPLVIEDAEPGDQFGFAVGSIDGDVLASAPFAGESDTGLVYRLDPATGLPRVTYGKATPAAGDFFGAAIAAGDGQVLVGAPLDASGGPPNGAVYLFDAASAAIVHALPNPNATQDLFGASVALGPWLVVGAPFADDGLGAVGTVWVFDRATGAVLRRLQNPRAHANDNFGRSVAIFGDLLAVGAPLADDTVAGTGVVIADTGIVYLFDAMSGELRQTVRNPPQGAFDQFGFMVTASATRLLVGSPGPSRIYLFDPIALGAGVSGAARFAALAAVPSTCGNGLVEGDEECDDGNLIDTDDCRNDCTRGPCCTLDVVTDAIARCDDRNPCTKDILDPVRGCRYEPNADDPTCCETDADCADGECRVCVGCFIYHWDCCDVGSRCIPKLDPACVAKTCVDAAACRCEGKLDCGDEGPIPSALQALFTSGCNPLRELVSLAPAGTFDKAALLQARQQTRNARLTLRKTIKMARAMTRARDLTTTCRKQIARDVRAIRKAIPRGKRLRRCFFAGG